MDKVTPEIRSRIMRLVRSKDTKLEEFFRKELWKKGTRYRKNPRGYYGKPDLAIKKKKTVIFLDSCFWHGCSKHCRLPKSNVNYWKNKIDRNIQRDKQVTQYYKDKKWTIIRLWEHEILKDAEGVVARVQKMISLKGP